MKWELIHQCGNGTLFKGTRNLSVVQVERPKGLPNHEFAADCMEFGAWHALAIHPTLQSFQGYDCVRFEKVLTSESKFV